MIERLLRAFAVLASLVVLLSWGLFAIDEARSAASDSATEIAGQKAATNADPSPEQERAREAAHGQVREAIDDADDVLVSPFAGVSDGSSSRWVRRTIPALIALLVYGLGVGLLAGFARR